MHRPGYVQGGQEANRGYLLLGVYHRRIPGDTTVYRCNLSNEPNFGRIRLAGQYI
jgi:hypothetical protein